jgi:hypothetical protein
MTRPDRDDIPEELALLAPGEAEQPRATAAWTAFQAKRAEPEQPTNWRFPTMFTRRFALGATLLVLVVALFSLPAVRAAASDFLGLFRVEKFAPISVSPQQMAMLEQIAEQGLHPGKLVMTSEPGEPQSVTSIAEAEALVGFRPRQIPSLGEPVSVEVEQGGSGQLIVDLEQMRAILGMAGVDPMLLPESLEGAEINVTLYPGAVLSWDDGTTLIQMQSPEIDYPDDVDPAVIGEALLQALGMSQAEARRLARAIDWSNTLVLPVPTNVASFREVIVDVDNSGLALSSVDGHGNALLWQAGNYLFLLTGDHNVEELLALTDAME